MSGKPWNAKRKTAFSALMRQRWRDGIYTERAVNIDQAERTARSVRMSALNERMKSNAALKSANIAGIHRSYLGPNRRDVLSKTMKQTMARPELRALAAAHCRRPDASERTSKGHATRRLKKLRARVEKKRR
jgi:hypothetical protein